MTAMVISSFYCKPSLHPPIGRTGKPAGRTKTGAGAFSVRSYHIPARIAREKSGLFPEKAGKRCSAPPAACKKRAKPRSRRRDHYRHHDVDIACLRLKQHIESNDPDDDVLVLNEADRVRAIINNEYSKILGPDFRKNCLKKIDYIVSEFEDKRIYLREEEIVKGSRSR